MNIDQRINEFFEPVAAWSLNVILYGFEVGGIEFKIIQLWLIAAALFFTIYLGFINLRFFKHAIEVVCGKHDKDSDSEGEISRFQALAASLSATVGLGNIGGVAVAVSIGGPGAVPWMILMGLFSMSTKFAEVMLAVKYRLRNDPNHPEEISGGPMYYLKEAFEHHNIPYIGSIIAVIFAICCIGASIGGGNMYQANQAYEQLAAVSDGFLDDKAWLFGLVLSFLVGIVIIGGIKSIASVASRLVPIMAAIYLTIGLIVIGIHYANIPEAFAIMFEKAFSPEAGIGGILGALLVGVQRAAFSNEAGLGSAAIVHSTAKCKDPVSQGMVGMLGPFIDTVIICTVTALVIVISGAYTDVEGVKGVELTSNALASGVSWFPYVLTLTVLLFAYSTMITWSYYGVKATTFLFGDKDWIELTFKLVFCLCIIVGASAKLGAIIDFSDAMLLSMAFPNIIGLYFLAPVIRKDVKAYIKKLKASA